MAGQSGSVITEDLFKAMGTEMEKCYENYILIDVGANLTNKKYSRDLDTVVQRAKDSGVQKVMVTGTSVKASKEALRLTRIYPGTIYSTAGIHPHDAKSYDDESWEELCRIVENPECVAVGECGLDYNRNFSDPEDQRAVFEKHDFMLRGIRRKWKQPVYYNFVSGGTKKHDLANIIKIVVRKCQNIGLRVMATVCDQGANNRAALNHLINETNEEYKRKGLENYNHHFEINGQKIIPLYDVPHLFKGLRNSLLKYNLVFEENNVKKLARWNDIFTAYKMDPYLGSIRLMPKITDQHVNPEKISKMKVSCCTQVFSHSVAAAVNVFAFSGTTVDTGEEILKLEKSASDTANLLEFLDQLFDSLNGSTFGAEAARGKKYRTAVTAGSPHLEFWRKADKILKTFKFLKKGKLFCPPSVKNLIITIENFRDLFNSLKNEGFNYMMPRTFNQDPLENFFGKIRQRGHRNINPTASDFTGYYKSLLVNGLTSPHSVGANCEEDNSDLFLSLQRFVSQIKLAIEHKKPLFIHERDAFNDLIEILDTFTDKLPPVVIHCFTGSVEHALAYLSKGFYLGLTGYLCKDKSDTGVRKLLVDNLIPLDRLVIETDSPFMYPNTRASKLPAHVKEGLTERSMTFLHRYCTFQRNEPCSLPAIVEMIAAFMSKKPEEVALATSFNAMKLFGLS